MLFGSAFFIFYIFCLLIILWLHIYETAKEMEEKDLSIKHCSLLVFFLGTTWTVSILGVIAVGFDVFIFQPGLGPKNIFDPFFGSITMLIALLLSVFAFILGIVCILILKFYIQNQAEIKSIFGLKVNRFRLNFSSHTLLSSLI